MTYFGNTPKSCSLLVVLVALFLCGHAESFVIGGNRFSFRKHTAASLSSDSARHYGMDPIRGELAESKVETHNGDGVSANDHHTRRRVGRLLFQSILIGECSWESFAQDSRAEESSYFLSGKVVLPPGMTSPVAAENSSTTNDNDTPATKPALYVTARPNRPDNVPRAILDGSRGKTPPVLAARFESPVFPFDFQLGEKDLTPEGADKTDSAFWWAADDLTVSARWDSDGFAATRSPEDLVGRNVWRHDESKDGFVLGLQGRGSFGKFATKK